MRFRKVSSGFSMLELLTVIGIIGIMASIVLVSLSSGRTDTALTTGAREVASALREAQNNALSGVRPASVSSNRTLCWFTVKRTGSTTADVIAYSSTQPDCSGGMNSSAVRTVSLKGGVTFSGAWEYGFSLPHGTVVNGGGAAQTGTLSIQLTANGKNAQVCLDAASGSVREAGVGGSCS